MSTIRLVALDFSNGTPLRGAIRRAMQNNMQRYLAGLEPLKEIVFYGMVVKLEDTVNKTAAGYYRELYGSLIPAIDSLIRYPILINRSNKTW